MMGPLTIDLSTVRRPAPEQRPYRVFFSSATECDWAREHCLRLVEVANGFLPDRFQIKVVRWEDDPPQQVHGESLQERYVRAALSCHAAVVLLQHELRPGTRAEVDALLELPTTSRELLTVVFEPEAGGSRSADVDDLLGRLRDAEVRYDPTGNQATAEAYLSLTRVTLQLMELTQRPAAAGGTYDRY